ncbi:MAG: ribosomal-processing cysteine protease Prp [bacterium]|nr:ribosomal-processing cysteine protease Prp [bacterium]
MIAVSFVNIEFKDGVFFREPSTISVTIEGHSGFGKKGTDIVCAAISALSQTMILGIAKIGAIPQKVTREDGYLGSEIDLSQLVQEKTAVLKIILDMFCIGIFEIEKEYPGSVEISFKNT